MASALPSAARLSAAIDVAVLEDWLASAEPGERIRYAWGPVAPRQLPAFVRAGELSREGEVRLHNPRSGDGPGFDWIAVRETPPNAAPPVASDAERDENDEEAVLRILRRHARLKLPCPTNSEIALQIAVKPEQAAYRVRRLKEAGLIRLEDRGPGQRRVVTIVGTGLTTPPGALS